MNKQLAMRGVGGVGGLCIMASWRLETTNADIALERFHFLPQAERLDFSIKPFILYKFMTSGVTTF